MTLDLAVLGIDGKPEKTVSINLEIHTALIDAASKHNLWTLRKLENYYSDAIYGFEEFDEISEQVSFLLHQSATEELHQFLLDFEDLVQYAQAKHKPVEAIAD